MDAGIGAKNFSIFFRGCLNCYGTSAPPTPSIFEGVLLSALLYCIIVI